MVILHSIHSLKYTYYILFASKLKGLVTNININLVISRLVNANASPDVPKPLYQWATPLIQSFGCTDSARALRRPTAHAPSSDTIHLG
jgi:hypothetical protein